MKLEPSFALSGFMWNVNRFAGNEGRQIFDQKIRIAVAIEIDLLGVVSPGMRCRRRSTFCGRKRQTRPFSAVGEPDITMSDPHGIAAGAMQLRGDFIGRGIDARNRDGLLRHPQARLRRSRYRHPVPGTPTSMVATTFMVRGSIFVTVPVP